MANRVLQQKLLKIAKARAKAREKRGYLKRWSVSKLSDGRPRTRPDLMKFNHGTMQALTYRDEAFIKTFSLNNPKQATRVEVLKIRDELEKQIPNLKWIILRPGMIKVYLVYHYISEENKGRGMEYFLVQHDTNLGLVKLSYAFESSASAIKFHTRGLVRWRSTYKYSVA